MTAKELKASILDRAIRGALVPQDPHDEPASALVARIRKERAAASARHGGRARRPATAAPHPIPDDEKPFDIPQNWQWVRLGEVINLLSGRDLEPSEYSSEKKKYPYMTGASNFDNGKLIVNRWTDKKSTLSHEGDLLITCKGTIGTMAYNVIGEIHIARQIMAISSPWILLDYVKIFLESVVLELRHAARSFVPGIDRAMILQRPIPLPPLAEQGRIVAQVEALRAALARL